MMPTLSMSRWAASALLVLLLSACGNDKDNHTHADAGGKDSHDHGVADDAGGGQDEDHADVDQTTIVAAEAQAAGIVTAPAGPGTIADEHDVQGLLTPIDGRTAQVTARFPGPIRALRVDVGDRVRTGQVLASIDSNLSLTTYTVTAPMNGVVLSRQAQVGGVAGEGQLLYELGNLDELWVDLHIFGNDTQHITAGVPVSVSRMTDGASQATRLERVLPGTATASQSTVARAVVRNDDGLWRPGAAVRARIVVASSPADIVVPLAAVQSMEGKDVVFVREGETYTARPVTLGARDAGRVALTAGVRAGEQVVVEQSYIVKADIGKAGAAHEH